MSADLQSSLMPCEAQGFYFYLQLPGILNVAVQLHFRICFPLQLIFFKFYNLFSFYLKVNKKSNILGFRKLYKMIKEGLILLKLLIFNRTHVDV